VYIHILLKSDELEKRQIGTDRETWGQCDQHILGRIDGSNEFTAWLYYFGKNKITMSGLVAPLTRSIG